MQDSDRLVPASMQRRLVALALYLAYFALWGIANLPALITPWWVSDDLALGSGFSLNHIFSNGRPLAIPFYYLISLESGPYGAAINVVARIAQGAIHAASALIIAYVLARRANTRIAYAAATIFLLYPFSGESVLWRSAAIIPVAALISLLGFLVAERGVASANPVWSAVGGLLVTVGVLVHQLGGVAAIVLWCLVLLVDNRPATRANLHLGLWLGAGYLMGGALSVLSTKLMLHGLMPRGGMSLDLDAKVPYVVDLVRSVAWDSHRTPMAILQAGLVMCALVAIVFQLSIQETRLADRLVRAAAWVMLLFAPFGPMLITVESPHSARMFYFSPLIFVGSVLAIHAVVRDYRSVRWSLAGATVLLIMFYLPVAWANAGAFVTLYRRDVASIRSAEATALRQNNGNPVQFVFVKPNDYLRSWDVQEVRVGLPQSDVDRSSDSKGSAFIVPWAFEPLITWYTEQSVTHDQKFALECANTCNDQPVKTPFAVFPLEGGAISCVCP